MKFYQLLFGWNVEIMDMGKPIGKYRILMSEGEMIGGVIPLDASAGLMSHWISYITVDDVDKACKQAASLGGKVPYDPFDIPNVGRTAVVQDTAGAYFSPFKGRTDDDNTAPAPRAGVFTWHELMSTNLEKAKPFYVKMMGWELEDIDMGEMGTYWLFKTDGNNTAGAIEMPKSAGSNAQSNWLPYVGVSDVIATAQKAVSLGGTLYVGPRRIGEPTNVHFAVLAGPDGSMFGIVEV